MKKFYITTPIYYVNANPHIGHAYTQIAVDAIARYHKRRGEDVFFLTGTDEHGEKIEEACSKSSFGKGREMEYVDSIVGNFKRAWEEIGVDFDRFIRTTEEEHQRTVQQILRKMHDRGDIYMGEYRGWFCPPCETFWTDKQAEDSLCPECGRAVERIEEKNYFFRMGAHQEWLVKYINDNPDFIKPEFRKNEVLGFLREQLNDLCISRPKARMSWGVELPFDKDYVVYVWFDALVNYLSGCKYLDYLKDEYHKAFNECWPADIHVIAKDILRHHAVYWPIILKSAGLPLPKTIFAHGWWMMGDDKMSKSKGNVVDPLDLKKKFGVDAMRYFLLKTVSFGQDGVFSEQALVTTFNSDLANDLGNLLNRTLTMVEKYFDGVSPEAPISLDNPAQAERSNRIKEMVVSLLPRISGKMMSPDLLLKEAIEDIMSVVGAANKYIEESAPWELSKKGDMESIKTIIADLLEVLRKAAIGLYPFIPQAATEIWRQLGLTSRLEVQVDEEEQTPDFRYSIVWRQFPSGTRIAKGDPLFPRILVEK